MAKFIIYGRPGCEWCEKAIMFLTARGVQIDYLNIRANPHNMSVFRKDFPYATTVPQIVFDDPPYEYENIGGYTDLVKWWTLRHNAKLTEGSDI